MKEKEEAPREPTRVRSRSGATRCPFCHDEVLPEADVRVCRECLSRHHAACWSEGGACASCGTDEALAPLEAERAQQDEAKEVEETSRRQRIFTTVLAVFATAFLVGVAQGVLPAFQKMFEETGLALPAMTQAALLLGRWPLLGLIALVGLFGGLSSLRDQKLARRLMVGAFGAVVLFLVIALSLPLIELTSKL